MKTKFLELSDVEMWEKYAAKFGMSTAREYVEDVGIRMLMGKEPRFWTVGLYTRYGLFTVSGETVLVWK